MALENYRDLSVGGTDVNAGFQFEFYCSNCNRKWKTPFKPYRMGQITGFLTRFAFLFGGAANTGRLTGTAADFGARGAKQQALAESMPQAERLYSNCVVCGLGFCEDCVDGSNTCKGCLLKAGKVQPGQDANGGYGAQSGGHACPNCGTAGGGGRFCAECGFDMASTHKSCPGCGAMAERSARFCGDCGHGF
jgi:hypothetical protein